MLQIMHLYIDMNSFFASCEQQENPILRGRPVAVVPMLADTTCAIAASYEAKKYGVKTGTFVRDAKAMCPDITFVPAKHRTYVQYHHKVHTAVEHCIPIDAVCSIDEFSCHLTSHQLSSELMHSLSRQIKECIREEVGEHIKCSIGIAPNRLLAKVAADMKKPDGLTILTSEDMAEKLFTLKPEDIPGIGRRMLKRLHRFGIYDMRALYQAPSHTLRAVWGGVQGARFHAKLHGEDIVDEPTHPSTVGHSQVLEPAKRNRADALYILKQLTEKAAERLRSKSFYATHITIGIKPMNYERSIHRDMHITESQHTADFLKAVETMWVDAYRHSPSLKPLRVSVALSGLVEGRHHQMDMFAPKTNESLLKAVDNINQRFGRGTLNFGHLASTSQPKTDKIAFQRVPSLYEVMNER